MLIFYAFHLNEKKEKKNEMQKNKKKVFLAKKKKSHRSTSKVSVEKHWEVNVIFIKIWSSIKGEDLCTIMTHDIIFMKPV